MVPLLEASAEGVEDGSHELAALPHHEGCCCVAGPRTQTGFPATFLVAPSPMHLSFPPTMALQHLWLASGGLGWHAAGVYVGAAYRE